MVEPIAQRHSFIYFTIFHTQCIKNAFGFALIRLLLLFFVYSFEEKQKKEELDPILIIVTKTV